ncbi:YbjN domain-containing protein [Thermopetrobacter sp. TC1]|uniref:YbjN domain-containing protein n=1 Tax=Thermopetrobacter sp. TC1 TaxID=1495045 RepID=UPI00056FFF9F|nr:YbjN domain-containing protein [Thermopetrobacter sp. TC1]
MNALERLLQDRDEKVANPLDIIENMATETGWEWARPGEDELMLAFPLENAEIQISLTWMEQIELLHLAAVWDFRCPEPRREELGRLLALINMQLPFGHFELWPDGSVVYRNALMLTGALSVTPEQCEALIAGAVGACETFYPAMHFVIWAGRSAEEAMRDCIFETAGEA